MVGIKKTARVRMCARTGTLKATRNENTCLRFHLTYTDRVGYGILRVCGVVAWRTKFAKRLRGLSRVPLRSTEAVYPQKKALVHTNFEQIIITRCLKRLLISGSTDHWSELRDQTSVISFISPATDFAGAYVVQAHLGYPKSEMD